MSKSIIVKIRNWSAYNKRKDYKKPWWFALSNRLVEDPDFFDFSPIEFKAWIYILSQASQQRSGVARLSLAHCSGSARIQVRHLESAISKLVAINALEIVNDFKEESENSVQNSNGICTESVTHRTEHNKTKQYITKKKEAEEFDFGKVFEKYPRKEGGVQGLERLPILITDSETFAMFEKAVDNYARHVAGKDPQYTKHFSTFVGVPGKEPWRDYVEMNASPVKRMVESGVPLDAVLDRHAAARSTFTADKVRDEMRKQRILKQ